MSSSFRSGFVRSWTAKREIHAAQRLSGRRSPSSPISRRPPAFHSGRPHAAERRSSSSTRRIIRPITAQQRMMDAVRAAWRSATVAPGGGRHRGLAKRTGARRLVSKSGRR